MNISNLYTYWQWLQSKPGGRWLFNRLLRLMNPYTGALHANIQVLRKGYAQLELKDRRGIRNHLNSVHAIALTNLGEFTSGMALLSLFSSNMRGIPVEINIQFLKKARGLLTAECQVSLPEFGPDIDPDIDSDIEHTVVAEIKNSDNDIVAITRVKWKLGYVQ